MIHQQKGHIEAGPQLKVSSDILVKSGIEPCFTWGVVYPLHGAEADMRNLKDDPESTKINANL